MESASRKVDCFLRLFLGPPLEEQQRRNPPKGMASRRINPLVCQTFCNRFFSFLFFGGPFCPKVGKEASCVILSIPDGKQYSVNYPTNDGRYGRGNVPRKNVDSKRRKT